MKKFAKALTASLITSLLPLQHQLINDAQLDNVAEPQEANSTSICFFSNAKRIKDAKSCQAGLIFVPADTPTELLPTTNIIFSGQPYLHFVMLLKKWLEMDKQTEIASIHASASIDASAIIGEGTTVLAGATIAAGVIIGKNCQIGEHVVIHKNVTIGDNTVLRSHVCVYVDCVIGSNVELHAGVVIGADGFGYQLFEGIQHKIPQVGNVIIHDYVEIGANSCVDRATLGSTIIGKGTKLDNLVQIGHNCQIGEYSILCAQVGLAGSTHVGDYVYIGGQVGAAGHLKIADKTMVAAQSGVNHSTKEGATLFGTPAIEAREAMKMHACLRQ